MAGIRFKIVCEPEDFPVEGNASAWDDEEENKRYAREIRERLDHGEIWAWCYVKVIASLEVDGETFRAESNGLGCCSYTDEEDFKRGGYYEDMQREARNALATALSDAISRGETARKALSRLQP